MKFRYSLFLLLALPGCALLKPQAQVDLPYEHSVRETAPDAFELAMQGERGFGMEPLKAAFQARGKALCPGKVYLLRGMREESYQEASTAGDGDRHALLGQIECVGLDYFEE